MIEKLFESWELIKFVSKYSIGNYQPLGQVTKNN